ncbi:hypothetical protein BBB56_12390 [Candidatus Pantoea deserta]|uniref:Uncharacterized protein n=1 Tax=Candidatus Pantoea deserta TaxID=1869313 RepID=A0A3N4NW88_9GAMM|nr:hypothetical protein [Pantoea deserta]RPE00375.1 hypothetical protein BBB56_12390 [Pantoea deserta]
MSGGSGFCCYGNEKGRFGADAQILERFACINELPMAASEPLYRWPLARGPDGQPGLSELNR